MDTEPRVKAVSPGLSSIMVETPDNAFVFIRPLQMYAGIFGQDTARDRDSKICRACYEFIAVFGKNIRKILRCYAFDQNTKTLSAKLKFLPGPESDQ